MFFRSYQRTSDITTNGKLLKCNVWEVSQNNISMNKTLSEVYTLKKFIFLKVEKIQEEQREGSHLTHPHPTPCFTGLAVPSLTLLSASHDTIETKINTPIFPKGHYPWKSTSTLAEWLPSQCPKLTMGIVAAHTTYFSTSVYGKQISIFSAPLLSFLCHSCFDCNFFREGWNAFRVLGNVNSDWDGGQAVESS